MESSFRRGRRIDQLWTRHGVKLQEREKDIPA